MGTRTGNILIAKWDVGVVYVIFDKAYDRHHHPGCARILNSHIHFLVEPFSAYGKHRYNYNILTYELYRSHLLLIMFPVVFFSAKGLISVCICLRLTRK